ncbi:hypothetical protein Tco_0877480 [Tanacetum coccineum]|uniref:O-methyltransferase domain-containing protein n=1 Tax=Tanacetum coccineum TaxID=301880 RepID=A0ABQ5C0Z1_9ASTR
MATPTTSTRSKQLETKRLASFQVNANPPIYFLSNSHLPVIPRTSYPSPDIQASTPIDLVHKDTLELSPDSGTESSIFPTAGHAWLRVIGYKEWAGSENHHAMLEKGSYIPWASRFLRYIYEKKDYGKMLKDSINNGQYKMKTIIDLGNATGDPIVEPYLRLQKEEGFTGDDKTRFEADIDAMNAILLGIPNDIYKYVDACKTTQAMCQHVKGLMQGTDLSQQEMTSRFLDEFDKFKGIPG